MRNNCKTLFIGIGLLFWLGTPLGAQSSWFISRDAKGAPHVESLSAGKPAPSKGLLLWADGASERWQVVPAGWRPPAEGETLVGTPIGAGASRSAVLNGSGTLEFGQLTIELDQLRIAGGTRDLDSAFLTPSREGRLLSGKLTIRRMPRAKGPAYPADVAELTMLGKTKKTWKIPFTEGEAQLTYKELGPVVADYPAGLPTGSFALKMFGKVTNFTIESNAHFRRMMQPIHEAQSLVNDRADPFLLLFAVDHLLGNRDTDGVPVYAVDTLDFLEQQSKLPAYFQKQRETIVRWLEQPPDQRAAAVRSASARHDEVVGIELIDTARGLLERSDLVAAGKLLRGRLGDPRSSPREKGLAHLYLGVIHAEGGLATTEKADEAFRAALNLLESATADDRLRVRNNWANYLHQQAQDYLHNHAFRMAVGVERPLAAVLACWTQADEQYQEAFKLAHDTKSAGHISTCAVNRARHYALLADLIRTLDTDRTGLDLVAAADRSAEIWIDTSLKTAQTLPLVQGFAKELRAQLAFRQGDRAAADKMARAAQVHYLEVGFLAGVENLQRLQGLTASKRADMIKHYRLSALISESMRARVPADRIGATQAGFFARKAWVFDKLTDLLVQEGKAEEALRVVELARARTLQDCMPKRIVPDQDEPEPFDWNAVRSAWPGDTVALEYFLGGEQAYVFFVNSTGKVRAVPLETPDGKPLASKALIGQVQRFLHDIEGQSAKMYRRILASQGFDHSWQDDLHLLYQELIPTSIRKEIASAKTTVIVPQHILHYFPFAALVTEKDTKKRGTKEMVAPKFWIEEAGQRLVTPSLALWARSRSDVPAPIKQVSAIGLAKAPGADELPGVEEDLKNLKAVFGSRVRNVVDGNKATVGAVTKSLKQPGMLFFGTHGQNDGERPLHSYLLLMPSPGDAAGRLTAQTVYQMPVEADLIVMSACYSGLGDRAPLPGDDLFGMQRAFLQSGSRAVVAGLWDVYDGTAPDLMKGFFQRFEKGQPVAQALHGSQRDFLQKLRASGKTEPWLHPYFWSVYVLIGDERVRFEKR